MKFQDRQYQIDSVNDTFNYWIKNPGKVPIIKLPTGSGKSVVIARIAERMQIEHSSAKPRGIITVPSKELCEQNAEKISAMMPRGISVDMYSASVGRKNAQADIVIATIGSVKDYPAELGYRNYWLNDECHLVSPDGTGVYWRFASGFHNANVSSGVGYCSAGLTATPFKGNGVWITDGKRPMYSGFSHKTEIAELLKMGFLSPLVNPQASISTRIDTSGIEMRGDDFNLVQLVDRTKEYLVSAAYEASVIAKDRMKWIAFLPDVSSAKDFCIILNKIGITAAVVTGDTDSKEREYLISQYKAGYIRCLITVIALTTGFDVPDIDCILWLRSTHSPVLYIQGAGRGTRIAPGKKDCLWIDFTDTTERLGAIDQINGRAAKKKQSMDAPCIICEACGARWVPASKEVCIDYERDEKGKYIINREGNRIVSDGCGHVMRVPDALDSRYASNAEVMAAVNPYPEFPVDSIQVRQKETVKGKKFISVEFLFGMSVICKHQLYFSGLGLTPESRNWFNIMTGDYQEQYNNMTSCLAYMQNQLIHNKRLGINIVKLDRTHNAKYPRLMEIIR